MLHNRWMVGALLLLATSAAPALAQYEANYLPKDAFFAFVARPQATLKVKALDKPAFTDALGEALDEAGFDVREVTEFLFVVRVDPEKPKSEPWGGFVVKSAKPFDKEKVLGKFAPKAEQLTVGGKTLYKGTRGGVALPDEHTLVVAERFEFLEMMVANEGAGDKLAEALKKGDPAAAAFGVMRLEPLRELIGMAMREAPPKELLPPPVQNAFDLPALLEGGMFSVNADEKFSALLSIECKDEAAATTVAKTIESLISLAADAIPQQKEMLKQFGGNNPEMTVGISFMEVFEKAAKDLKPAAEGNKVSLKFEGELQPLVDLVEKGVIATRRAAGNITVTNNMRHIGLALHNYHDVNGKLPPAASKDKDGKPLLSWRVAILPYLEQDALYKEFRLDEPWDSEHNKELVKKMPKIFGHPKSKSLADAGKTRILAPIGGNTIFTADKGRGLREIVDGTSNTLIAVEVDEASAVEWTKPDDLAFDPEKPLKGLADINGRFTGLFADGSVRMVKRVAELMAAVFSCNGGEAIDSEKLFDNAGNAFGVEVKAVAPDAPAEAAKAPPPR